MAHEEKIAHTGFHAEIFRGELPSGDMYLSKHFGKKSAHGFEPSHALSLIGSMRSFVEKAGAIGVPVHRPIGYYLENNHVEGLVNLVEAVRHVGPDFKEIIDAPESTDGEIFRYVDQYLDLFSRVWEADFPIALDPPPANFCVSSDGTLHFIDHMPPRQKLTDGRLLSEMPDPPEASRAFIESRYFSPIQARVIYAQLLRSFSGRAIHPAHIKEAIGEHLGPVAFSLIDLNGHTQERLLTAPQQTDVDMLRILAGEAFFDGKVSREQLTSVYKSAHIGTGGILPTQQEVNDARDVLVRAL